MLINSASAGVVIPKELEANGQLVLNISFKARFQDKSQETFVPCDAVVLSIYAKGNGEGIMFDNKKTNKKIKNLALKF